MPRLSIIVPATAAQGPWEETLASVLASRPADCEVIVAHAGPYEDPYDLGGEVRFLPAPSRGGLIGCLNVGIQSARGEVVHLLAGGMQVSEGWVEPALEVLAQADAVAPLVVDDEDSGIVHAAGIRYQARGGQGIMPRRPRRMGRWLTKLEPAAPTLWAGFYRREMLLELGGLVDRYGEELAAADLALRMAAAGYQCRLATESRIHAAALPVAPAGFAGGRGAERLFWSAAAETGWLRSLAAHPVYVAARWLTSIHRPGGWLELIGRIVGALELQGNARARAGLKELRQAQSPQVHSLPARDDSERGPLKRAA